MKKVLAIAIYLPQFHPIPENDKVWGDGFTEWTNVKKASPLFKSHYQPHIPHKNLGYYDLRDPDVLVKQADLAKQFGIYGFAFYHYWFNGKQLLGLPVENMIELGKPDFPFCLFWANETWSKRWLGEEKEIIIKQTYSEEDDYSHIKWLIKAFKDPRYIKVNGRPVFIFYRPTDLPDTSSTLKIFRDETIKSGLENPFFIASNSHAGERDLYNLGFDGILNFEPQLGVLPFFMEDNRRLGKLFNNIKCKVLSSKLKVYDYNLAHDRMFNRKFSYKYFPCIFVNWDNTPRRGPNGIILKNSSPEKFRYHLGKTLDRLFDMNFKDEESFIFINAWNEWAEGNHLEPDVRFGMGYLNSVKDVLNLKCNGRN